MNIVEANRRRAVTISDILRTRLIDRDTRYPGTGWERWDRKDELEGELSAPALFQYMIPNTPMCAIIFRDPVLTEVQNLELGKPRVISSKEPEIYSDSIENDTDASFEEEVSKTLSKTVSLQEGIKAGAEASAKASLSFDGIGGEIAAKVYAEYQRQWGESTTQSNTVSRKITVPPHTSINYEVIREVDNMQRQVKAYADFTYFIRIISGPDGTPPHAMPPPIIDWMQWETLYTVMIGEAPVNTPLYGVFKDRPLTKKERRRLDADNHHNVEFTADYENVKRQSITIKNQ